MIVIKCDKCGKEIKNKEFSYLALGIRTLVTEYEADREFIVCPECRKEFYNFMEIKGE